MRAARVARPVVIIFYCMHRHMHSELSPAGGWGHFPGSALCRTVEAALASQAGQSTSSIGGEAVDTCSDYNGRQERGFDVVQMHLSARSTGLPFAQVP